MAAYSLKHVAITSLPDFGKKKLEKTHHSLKTTYFKPKNKEFLNLSS